MANLKLNNVIVVAESSGTATLQNSIIKVKADGIKASDGTASLTIADTTGAVSLASNLTVAGDLTINGTTTTLSTQTVEVEDNILQLNTNLLEQRILRELEENPALEMEEINEKSESEIDKEMTEESNLDKNIDDDSVKELDEKTTETDFDWEELMGDPDEYDFSKFCLLYTSDAADE